LNENNGVLIADLLSHFQIPENLTIPSHLMKGTKRNGQEYVNPLFVMTGEGYAKMTFDELLHKIQEAVRSGPRVIADARYGRCPRKCGSEFEDRF
jgi:hypothetical protein